MNKNFSVSISVYGGDDPSNFKLALKSIINQTVKPSEIILVIDGPIKPKTELIIKDFKKEYDFLKIIRLNKNLGHGEARRIGLENCKYDLVALMDSDDISVENRFELQVNYMLKNPEVDVLGGQILEFEDCESKVLSKRIVPETHDNIIKYLKWRCPFNQMTVMFRKNKVFEAGGYKDWYCNEDYYLWIRMYLNENIFYNLPNTLVKFRIDSNMYQRRGGVNYFKSEFKIQQLLKRNKIITTQLFMYNVLIRFIIQIMLPNKLRKWFFINLFRKI